MAKQEDDDSHDLCIYLGLSFAVFLGTVRQQSTSSLQSKNKALSLKLIDAEEKLNEVHSRRKEDSKANARVAEIFASHRHGWQQEEKRLLEQIDGCNQEILYLKGKLEDSERLEAEMKATIQDLRRERDEMMNFMVTTTETKCFDWDQIRGGMTSDFCNSAASHFWSTKSSNSWQEMQYDSMYHSTHFVARRESPWKKDGESNGVSSKLREVEQELLNFERVDISEEARLRMRKLANKYQELAAKMDNLCGRMEATLSSELQTHRHREFLLEAFRLQQHVAELNDKLIALQAEARKIYDLRGQAKRWFESLRNSFKQIQRNLEIWLARIIGDLEGTLARDGTVMERCT